MKKSLLLLVFLIQAICLTAQPNTFIKKITDNDCQNFCSSIKEGYNRKFYTQIVSVSPTETIARGQIFKIDQAGNKEDSIDISMILGKPTYYSSYNIENYKNNFFFTTLLNDSTHKFLYARVFDTTLQTVKEAIIDTLQENESLLNHLVAKNGHHIFLTGTYTNYWWDLIFRVTDSNFTNIIMAPLLFSDGGYPTCVVNHAGLIECSLDSTFFITSYNWTLKVNRDFSHIDTVSNNTYGMVVSTFNNTIPFNDSVFFYNIHKITQSTVPPFDTKTLTFINQYDMHGLLKDSLVVDAPYADNRVTQCPDFLSFRSPDSIFYCFAANYSMGTCFGIAQLNQEMEVVWQKYVQLPQAGNAGSISATMDGGCIIQWEANGQIYLIKTDGQGNVPNGFDHPNAMNKKRILLFPNPAHDQLFFDCGLYTGLQIRICNASGQSMINQPINDGQQSIDIGSFEAGVYFVQFLKGRYIVDEATFIKQ